MPPTLSLAGMRFDRWTGVSLLILACRVSAPGETADVTVLRAAIADWQEGPTAGHVCLDARVLRRTDDQSRPAFWDAMVLDSLLADSLIAVDPRTLPMSHSVIRSCLPGRKAPRIAVGIPQSRHDSVYVAMTAWRSPADADAIALIDAPVILARNALGWRIIAHPAQHFQILEQARSDSSWTRASPRH